MLRQSFRRQRLLSDLRRSVFLEEFLTHRFRCLSINVGKGQGTVPESVCGLFALEQFRSLQAMLGETVTEETVTRGGPFPGGVDARVLFRPDFPEVLHAIPVSHRDTEDEFPPI